MRAIGPFSSSRFLLLLPITTTPPPPRRFSSLLSPANRRNRTITAAFFRTPLWTAAMSATIVTAKDKTVAADSGPTHVVGDWYSVPELRLRDHRFSVPLDHSLSNSSASPKISVFAREVVAGAWTAFRLSLFWLALLSFFLGCLFSFSLAKVSSTGYFWICHDRASKQEKFGLPED